MAEFVVAPYLPKHAKTVLIGEKYAVLLAKPLEELGVSPFFVPDNQFIDARLAGHTDLSCFHARGEKVWLAPHLRDTLFISALEKLGARISFADIVQDKSYPMDAQLNIAPVGSAVFYNPKVSYLPAVDFLTSECGYTAVEVRQGYVKCSVLVVDEHSIITSDAGIARAAKCAGLEVLEVSPGGVALDGFEYGFIGGAGFKLSSTQLAFTGVLDYHPDKARILSFLAARGIDPVYLTNRPVFDIGSAIPLIER